MTENENISDHPLVSVIMPAFNSAQYIEASIKSVLSQTYKNLELIIIDDGSSDSTFSIIEDMMQTDLRIKGFSQNNAGVSAARNFAINNATGKFVAFCDSDDIWYSDKLEKQLATIQNFNWSHTDSRYFGLGYDNREPVFRSDLSKMCSGFVFKNLVVENFITTSSVLIKKSLIIKYGCFDESLEALEDWYLWLKIARSEPLAFCDKVLLDYRVLNNSTSRKARKLLPLHIQILNHTFENTDEIESNLKKDAFYKAYEIFSYIAEENNDKTFAVKCSLNLFKYHIRVKGFKRLAKTILNCI